MVAASSDKAKEHTSDLRRRLRRGWRRFNALVWEPLLPKGLYARALLIIILPIVLLQSVLVFVVMERHWEYVTKRLTTATAQDIAMLVSIYEKYPHQDNYTQLIDIARKDLGLLVRISPGEKLPPARARPFFFARLDRLLTKTIRTRIDKPFWIDALGNSTYVDIRIDLGDATMKVLARRSQTYASNTPIFLGWMLTTSLILLTAAVLFLRNQIRPILSLAEAAECFGRGQPVPKEFRIRGAREVRQAAQAFIEMRDRIERHVEQRTAMLAGVSHDLRTVLTRFRLQLAMMKPSPEIDELVHDVDDMQAMLEDYLAFARGGSGEEAQPIDMRSVLGEIHSAFNNVPGRIVTIDVPVEPMMVTIRRNAFKRGVMNLVSNATKFGNQVLITGTMSRRNILIIVEDNGPGVPPDMRETVFRPFFSMDNARNQNVKSTGLGLAIARDIIRAHGGEIHLGESRMGGLKARIRVPI
jgi:two-component system, OmpR family, osmolarity sensor histidine kinase EnvZ